MPTLSLKPWTDSTGAVRRYVNNLPELIGLEYETYKTGNIRSASVNGERIYNAAAQRILNAKVWLDSDNKVHVDYWTERDVVTRDQVRQLVAELYAQNPDA